MQATRDIIAVAPPAGSADPPPFPLLSLPPELWSRICIEAATSIPIITIECRRSSTYTARDVRQPPITRVCRAIRTETLSAFYGSTEFHFMDHHWSDLVGLAKWVGVMIKEGKWAMVATCILQSNDKTVEWHLRSVLKKWADLKGSEVRSVRLNHESLRSCLQPAYMFRLETVQAAEASDTERPV